MKIILKKILPDRAYVFFSIIYQTFSRILIISKLIRVYIYDAKHYIKNSSTFVDCNRTKDMIEARIIANTHIIEKGLSFNDIKLNFGQDVIQNLLALLNKYQQKYAQYCSSSIAYNGALSVLYQYIEFHNVKHQDVSELTTILKQLNMHSQVHPGGVNEVNRDTILLNRQGDFLEFIKSRHSIRNFTREPVPLEKIQKAIEIAQYSPSVCNRQSARVHVIRDPELMKRVLHYQDGNRGFGHLINSVLIVTSNTNAFEGVKERNQAYIDGGLYAMNLLYGLHYEGIGACCLCWMTDPNIDQMIKKSLNINNAERIILMIAVGQMPVSFFVTESKRKPWADIYTIV